MAVAAASDDGAEPNLTPILDMVFQLITFFMLVINFKSAAMDLTLRLPAVGSARPVETRDQDLLVLNIDRNGELRVFGAEVTGIPEYIASRRPRPACWRRGSTTPT